MHSSAFFINAYSNKMKMENNDVIQFARLIAYNAFKQEAAFKWIFLRKCNMVG